MAQLERVLIISDAHRPYHDKKAWALMLKVGKWFKPHHLIVNGDMADFYSVSSHSKDPFRKQQLIEEVADVNTGFDELDTLGAKDKRFIAGNHEDRLKRYLQDKAPEIFGLVSLPQLFHLKERGWKFTDYRSDTKLGKLYITHDTGNAGRYASYKALDTYQKNVTTGHAHRMSYIVEGNAVGESKVSAQFGWLGDASKADYMHKQSIARNWSLGFGIGYLHPKTGIVYLTPVPIVEYTCVVNGKLFQ